MCVAIMQHYLIAEVRHVCTTQAHDKFEQWHAEKWLSPRRVLQKAGAEMQPVLLPFWLFEAAIKVEYAAKVLLQKVTLSFASLTHYTQSHVNIVNQ